MLTRLKAWVRDRELDRRIRKHGWTGLYVGEYGQAPAWTYTIGFDETLNQPEIVVFDIPRDSANGLLWQAYRELESGELRLEDGAVWSNDDNAPIWRKVHPSQIAGAVGWLTLAAERRFRRTRQWSPIEAFQLVLPDPEGNFPWEDGYDEHLRPRQPALYLPENDPQARDMIDAEREARRLMSERGWTVVPVDGPKFCWAYSVGFSETLGVPDVVTFGPEGRDANRMLIDVQKHLRDGRLTLEDSLRWDGLGFEVCWRRVHPSQYLEFNWFYLAKAVREERTGERAAVETFQMFISDAEGRYPWDEGCDRYVHRLQPKLYLPRDPARIA